MSIKVIGAGFGRTGTKSLQAALERLGFVSCHHMTEVIANPEQAPVWVAASRGEAVDWRELLAGYQAVVDWPGCTFYRQLMDEFPDSKVVLTIRDPARWYESVADTIYTLSTTTPRWLTWFARPLAAVLEVSSAIVWTGTFADRFSERAHAIAVFEAHIEEVKRVVPAERLLVFSVKDGWGPLCEFLELPRPVEPFPHLNDRAEMRRRIVALRRVRAGARVAGLALVGLALALARRR